MEGRADFRAEDADGSDSDGKITEKRAGATAIAQRQAVLAQQARQGGAAGPSTKKARSHPYEEAARLTVVAPRRRGAELDDRGASPIRSNPVDELKGGTADIA